MAINRDELLKDVRKIINESIQLKPTSYDVTQKFNIHRYITGLIEEGHKNPELMNMLVRYDNILSNGGKDFMLFEQFGNELAKYSVGNRSIKKIIKEMNETLGTDSMALTGYQLIENITDPYTKETVEDAFTNYVTDPCADTLNMFIDALDLVYAQDEPLAMKLNLLITKDSGMSDKFIHSEYTDDTQYNELNNRLQQERERRLSDEIYSNVEKYIADRLDAQQAEEDAEQEKLCLDYIANNQGLNLGEHLAYIANSDAKTNERLMQVVGAYAEAVRQGAYQERLYETFIQNVSKFNYLVPVEKTIKAINETVKEKYEEITLTKILEEMKENQYSFIYVDLIQEDVARYVNEPSATNRVQLRNALAPHVADPFVNEMFKVLYADNLKRDNELTEQALNIKEQINIIRENASVLPIYTPVQYIKENECVFNVNGQYYIKKGNNIAILEDKYIDQLDESFIELCHLVNDPHVEINENYIEVYGANNLYAKVFEGYVDVLNVRESKESLRDLRTMCMKHDNYDTNFYIMCSCLLENFNNIAKIDWAKHITLNENNNINADLFKLDNNIFVATHNDTLGQHTFYRNVNPIFCRNKINEHMGINVSSLFNDLLPNQHKIILKLNETKSSYEESIAKYEDIIEELKAAKEKATDENKKEIEKAIDDAEAKLDDIKEEYKKWQKETAEATGTDTDVEDLDDTEDPENDSEETVDSDSDDDSEDEDDSGENVRKEQSNEPVSDDEVEDQYDELTTPLDTYSDDETSEEISDEDFDNFLDMDDSGDDMDTSDDEDTETIVDDSEDDTDDLNDVMDDSDEDFDTSDDEDIEDTEEFTEVDFGDDSDEEDSDDILDITADTDDSDEEDFEVDMDDSEDDEDVDMSDYTDDSEDATDLFGGDTEDPLETKLNPDIDAYKNAPKVEGEDEHITNTPDFSYKIANVMFDENLKTNEMYKSGEVIAIVPMVNGEGKSYIDNRTIRFYIDEESNVILDNEEMTGDLYNAVINSIRSHPAFQGVCADGLPAEHPENNKLVPAPVKNDNDEELSWEEEYLRDGNDEDRNRFGLNAEEDEDEWGYLNNILKGYDELEDSTSEEETTEEPVFTMDDETEDEDIIIPMYKDGDTEIELPAANVDNTIIPESVKTPKKKALKESITISAVYKKGKKEKHFFVNESTTTDSKKPSNILNSINSVKSVSGNAINESIYDEYDEETENNPIENYIAANETDIMKKLHNYALELYQELDDNGLNHGEVSDIKFYGDSDEPSEYIEYFDIDGDLESLELGNYESYRIFRYETNIYYISVDDVVGIMEDNRFADRTVVIKELIEQSGAKVSIHNEEDCIFMINSVFRSMYNYSSINENCKIRRKTKLQADNDVDLSKTAHDAKYGTKEENDFKQELEDKQKKDGTIGALDPALEESVKPKLPNVNLLTEKKVEVIYEVNDPVIYNKELWHIYAIDEADVDDEQTLHITKNGLTLTVKSKDVEPEPELLNNLTDNPPYDDSENISRMITKKDLKDLNKATIECNIVVDGYVVNENPMKASLQDIMEGNEYISVENADGDVSTCHVDTLSFNKENWPYAVLISSEETEEPVRKIRVNPISYINADEDDMVEITVAGKLTTLPKSSIRILS